MRFLTLPKVIYLVSCWALTVFSTDFQGCLGPESHGCCDKVELFPDDKLTLESLSNQKGVSEWCDRVVIVRQNSDNYDECSGCSLTVQFVSYSNPFAATVELLQANYSSTSYFASEMLYLEPVASYGAEGDPYFPGSKRSPGTVLKLVFTLPSPPDSFSPVDYTADLQLKMVITPNTPSRSSNVTAIIGITVPLVVLFIVFNVVIYKLRQRRIARVREQLRSRLTAIVVDAAMDAAILQQARAREASQNRSPHSPDPDDSVAPPSYSEAAPPPPKYEDIVMEDSAAPDTGRDDGRLVIDS